MRSSRTPLLLKTTRQQYHQRIAWALEARFPETAEAHWSYCRVTTSGWFTEGFDTADLKEAKALLEELR